jgi:hypothetical protein
MQVKNKLIRRPKEACKPDSCTDNTKRPGSGDAMWGILGGIICASFSFWILDSGRDGHDLRFKPTERV